MSGSTDSTDIPPTTSPPTTSSPPPTTSPPTTSLPTSSPVPLEYTAIGVIGFILIIIAGMIALAAIIVVYQRRKRRRVQFRNTDADSPQPVKYKPSSDKKEPQLNTQRSMDIMTNPAYGSAHNIDEEVENSEEYVDVTSGEQLIEGYYEEITKESLAKCDSYEDTAPYIENIDEFLSASKKQDLVTGQGAFVSKAEKTEKEGLGSLATGRKNNPNYVNNLDEIAHEIKKIDLACEHKMPHPQEGDSKYVNDLDALMKQGEELASDEDEEGYTVYDPKRTTRQGDRGRRGLERKENEEPVYYQNSIVQIEQQKPPINELPKEKQSPSTVEPVDVRPYVNDLQKAIMDAQAREMEGEVSGKRRNPYVNDITGLLEAALREQEAQSMGRKEEGGSPSESKKNSNYVNDITSLLPTV